MAIALDLTKGSEVPWDGINKHFVVKKSVDFTVAANYLATTLIMALMELPAGILIESVVLVVKTVDADVSDVDIGIATSSTGATISADGFIDGGTLVATGIVRDLAGETYSKQDGTFGFLTTVATKVILTNNDADTINGAKVDFFALCVDLR